MSVFDRLMAFEKSLPTLDLNGWTMSDWPAEGAHAGMRVDRIHRLDGDTRLMLHRFWPDEGREKACLHPHPYALATHVVGPGSYEVGFAIGNVCHARATFNGDFYYEMRTPEVRHYVSPISGPVFSCAIWTPFPEKVEIPKFVDFTQLGKADDVVKHVTRFFDALYD